MATTTISITEIANLIENLATLNLGYLGIAVTILIFLGGAFYLFNFKPLKDAFERQEKTLTDLEKEVKENLASSKKEIREELNIFKDEQVKTISNIFEQKSDKLLSDIQTKIANFEKEFIQKFDSFAEEKDVNLKTVILAEVSNKVRELEKSLSMAIDTSKTEIKKETTSLKSSLVSVQDDLKEVKRKARELEVFKYSLKGQMGAIYGSIDLLKDAIDENSWRIDGSLEDLYKEIADCKLEGEVITRIEEQLVRLNDKPKYNPLVSKIRKKYQT